MKIDKVLFVSDSNLNYLSFWPSVSKYYTNVLGFKCKLFFIGEPDETTQPYLIGDVQIVKPIKDVPIIIQALWAKFWFTQTEPHTNWMIGDIDMYILDKKWLFESLEKIPEDGYGHIFTVLDGEGKPYFPGYSHVASGKKFKEYLELTDNFEEECKFIYSSKKYGIFDKPAPPRIQDKQYFEYICCEEQLSTERLTRRLNEITLVYHKNHNRLETPWAYRGDVTPSDVNLLMYFNRKPKEYWQDFHCPRPYTAWREQIEEILSHYF